MSATTDETATERPDEATADRARDRRPPSILTELFQGRLPADLLQPWPAPTADENELCEVLLDALDKFLAAEVDPVAIDREARLPDRVLDGLRELGLFGLIIPEEHGGLGLGMTAYTRVLARVATWCASTATTVGAHSSIGLKALLLFGDEAQKRRWLPSLATGERIAAFCLTEPGAGSDAGSVQCKAMPDGEGGWILDGVKTWITNGGIAGLYTVFARTPAPEGWKPARPHLACFVVEREQAGVSTGAEEDKLGLKGSSTTEVRFENVRLAGDQLLGSDGEGFKMALEVLNSGRLGLAGGCAGTARDLCDKALAQAREREQFGRPIAGFELIQQKLATMAAEVYAMESTVYLCTGIVDRRGRGELDAWTALEAAAAKIYCTERLWDTCHEALQIAGGNGFMRDFPYERRLRDARVNMIFEGTNEILRLMVALHCLEPLGAEIKEALKGIRKLGRFFPSLGALLRFQFGPAPHLPNPVRDGGELADRAWSQVEACLRALPQAARTVLLRHGNKIFERQEALAWIADLAQEALVALATYLRCFRAGPPAEGEWVLCADVLRRKRERIRELGRKVQSRHPARHKALVQRLVDEGKGIPGLW